MAEELGVYCLKIIIDDPLYVITYISTHHPLMLVYAQLLGTEFYFKQNDTSEIKYDYIEFKKILNEKISNDKSAKNMLDIFYNEIELVMKNMD